MKDPKPDPRMIKMSGERFVLSLINVLASSIFFIITCDHLHVTILL